MSIGILIMDLRNQPTCLSRLSNVNGNHIRKVTHGWADFISP